MRKKAKNIERLPISNIILNTIYILDGVYKATLPSEILKRLNEYNNRKYSKRKIQTMLGQLHKRGDITFNKKAQRVSVELTTSGTRKLASYKAHTQQTPKKWDRKWRVVVFDIKEKQRGLRDKLRLELRQIGFVLLQNSVWVYPYDCEEYITLLKLDERIGKSVLYIVADYIEQDKVLKKHFKLK